MIFIEFIILLLSSLGLLNVLLFSPIMEWFRELIVKAFKLFGHEAWGRYFVACPACTGVWIGILMTYVYINGWVFFTLPLAISFLGLLGQLYWFPISEDEEEEQTLSESHESEV